VKNKNKKSTHSSLQPWSHWKDTPWWKEMVHSSGKRPFIRWTPAPSSSWPFMAACYKQAHPKSPLVVITPGLKLQESMHQDLTTWLQWFNNQEFKYKGQPIKWK